MHFYWRSCAPCCIAPKSRNKRSLMAVFDRDEARADPAMSAMPRKRPNCYVAAKCRDRPTADMAAPNARLVRLHSNVKDELQTFAGAGGRLSPSRCFPRRRRTDRHHQTLAPTRRLPVAFRASPGPLPFEDRHDANRFFRPPASRESPGSTANSGTLPGKVTRAI